MKNFVTVLLFLSLLISCGPTEPLTERDPYEPPEEIEDYEVDELLDEMDEFEILLYEHRSMLADQFSNLQHDMPEIYLKEKVEEELNIDEYAGFRVQLLSTRDVALADSTRDNFMAWASTRIAGYEDVEAYVFFRQPYYRVRAGDFRDREKAIEFSRMIKGRYPEAWVVHDRIDPQRVPADTVNIRFREPSELLQDMDFQ